VGVKYFNQDNSLHMMLRLLLCFDIKNFFQCQLNSCSFNFIDHYVNCNFNKISILYAVRILIYKKVLCLFIRAVSHAIDRHAEGEKGSSAWRQPIFLPMVLIDCNDAGWSYPWAMSVLIAAPGVKYEWS
jgi:hypothetical protein